MTWHPWTSWECIGMYTNRTDLSPEAAREAYAEFLRDDVRFEQALHRVITEWPMSCQHFLSKDINRIAWLGQASMCIATGVPRDYRSGFMLLSNEEQTRANALAARWLAIWESKRASRGTWQPGVPEATPTTSRTKSPVRS